MATCATIEEITNIEAILESFIVDWMLDLKNNMGLLENLEEIHPEDSIISNNDISESAMYSMADEMARIKYAVAPIYATAVEHRANIDSKLQALCDRMEDHRTNRNAWLAYRSSLDPEDPNYSSKYNTATTNYNTNETYRQNKQNQINTLKTDADAIISLINTEFVELARGVLKARYNCNTAVGSIVNEDVQAQADEYYIVGTKSNTEGYALAALNKIGKWSEFAQSLEIVNKLKSITFNTTVPNGSGSLSSTIGALSARDASFNDDNELVVTSDMEYKPAIIAAYGPEMVSAASLCESAISTEYSFTQQLLVSRISGNTIEYDPKAVSPGNPPTTAWVEVSATFETASWYEDRNDELDVLPDPYIVNDDPLIPVSS